MYFDKKAKDWDNDSQKIERAVVFAQEIKNNIPLTKKLNALEFGCGTGLLSFQFKDFFASITLADNSAGMIAVLNEKIAKHNIKNFKTINIDLEITTLAQNNYDVVYTSMTLHHIIDINKIAKKFNNILKNNGYLCIADLVTEDGTFHSPENNFNGHYGFDKIELTKTLAINGFKLEYYNECFIIEKTVNNVTKKYPLFIMISKKIKEL